MARGRHLRKHAMFRFKLMSGNTVTGKALLFNTLPLNARLGPFCG
jgi:hypothetical protein